MEKRERVDYADGIRGIAVLLVLIGHAWRWSVPVDLHSDGWGVLGIFDMLGTDGVALFLVLSGFCLSYGSLRKRQQGAAKWFTPSRFFARRCLRILPPYYAALAIYVILALLLHGSTWIRGYGTEITWSAVVSHLLLWHNNVPSDWDAISGPFWSLGLEWQWYWIFPAVLYLVVHRTRTLAVMCVATAMATEIALWIGHITWLTDMIVPERIAEFAFGVVAAHVLLQPGRASPALLWLGGLLCLFAVQFPILLHLDLVLRDLYLLGVYNPLTGMGFALLVVAVGRTESVRTCLTWRPLVALGTISYSVYLMHTALAYPVGLATLRFGVPPLVSFPLTMASGLLIGGAFYWSVERHCMRGPLRERSETGLIARFGWLDAIYAPRTRRNNARIAAAESVAAMEI